MNSTFLLSKQLHDDAPRLAEIYSLHGYTLYDHMYASPAFITAEVDCEPV